MPCSRSFPAECGRSRYPFGEFVLTLARGDAVTSPKRDRASPPLLDIFAAWRLEAVGYSLAATYAVIFFLWYETGGWLVDSTGTPLPDNDLVYWWVGGTQALRGNAALLYDPVQLKDMLASLVGAGHANDLFYPNWPYPPIFFLFWCRWRSFLTSMHSWSGKRQPCWGASLSSF